MTTTGILLTGLAISHIHNTKNVVIESVAVIWEFSELETLSQPQILGSTLTILSCACIRLSTVIWDYIEL